MLASLAASADSGTAGPSADGVGAADLEALHDGARGFERLYMVGDNPLTDIRGALDAGPRWSSLLVGTGMWQPGDDTGGATAVVDDVGGRACERAAVCTARATQHIQALYDQLENEQRQLAAVAAAAQRKRRRWGSSASSRQCSKQTSVWTAAAAAMVVVAALFQRCWRGRRGCASTARGSRRRAERVAVTVQLQMQ